MKSVSTAELDKLRQEAAAAICDLAATIKRDTNPQRSPYGSPTDAGVTTVISTMVGLAQPSAAQLQEYSSKIGTLATWIAQFPYGTAIQEGDIVTIGGRDRKIQRDLTPQSYAILTSALISEVS